ncbi:hypothetical protein [Microbulbifer sp. HZ11]|uniref:hypothetical protein n=1 Tax=Microbulbifer sp. HZ11 TaxID=1453501 RepID=UPI0005BD2878|nr:hypothetical protein [Microbulbifer sp. HZ11]
MPLNPAIKHTVAKKLEEYEGRYNHLYLDTVGKVTVGIGHLIPDRHAITTIPMYNTQNGIATTPATTAEKQQEFDHISKQKRNFRAKWYKQYCKLIMKDSDIEIQRDRHISSFYIELSTLYSTANGYAKNFDSFPDKVQLALFDMIFNIGATKLKKQFIKFNKAIQNENWLAASTESHRPQVSPSRNAYVQNLLKSAHQTAVSAQP